MFPQSNRRLSRVTILFASLVAIGFIIATFDVRSESDNVADVLREVFPEVGSHVVCVRIPFL